MNRMKRIALMARISRAYREAGLEPPKATKNVKIKPLSASNQRKLMRLQIENLAIKVNQRAKVEEPVS